MTACVADGKALWDQHCAKCHGKDGKGHTFVGEWLYIKGYANPNVQQALTGQAAFKAVKEGDKEKNGRLVMRPSKDLSDSDILALAATLRRSMGHRSKGGGC